MRPAPKPLQDVRWTWLVALLLLALGLRVLLFLIRDDPWGGELLGDAAYYERWARQIASGQAPSDPFWVDPGYAYFLAACFKSGLSIQGVLQLQILIDTASVALTFFVARQAGFEGRVPYLAAALAACYEPSVLYSLGLLKPTLALFLFQAALLACLWAARPLELKPQRALLAGLAIGLCGLTRGNLLILAPCFVLYRAWLVRPNPRWVLESLACAGGLLIALLPLVAHNNPAKTGVLLTANYGVNLYLANNPENRDSGLTLHPSWLAGDPLNEDTEWEKAAASRLKVASLTPAQRESYWAAEARQEIGSNPGAALKRVLHRVLLFANAYEIPDNRNLSAERDLAGGVRLLGWVLVFPFGLVGLIAAARRHGRAPPGFLLVAFVTCALVLMPFGVYSRYRFPLSACLFGGAAHWLLAGVPAWSKEDRSILLKWAAPVLVLLLISLLPILESERDEYAARHHYGIALVANRRQDPETALREALKAVEHDPELTQAHLEAGLALARLGRDAEAIEAYTSAMQGRPEVAGLAAFNAALIFERNANHAQAAAAFRQAAELLSSWNPSAARSASARARAAAARARPR